MYAFNYHRPTSLADIPKTFGAAEDAKLMAGGQTLIPTLKQRLAQPSDIIDLGQVAELKGIRRSVTAARSAARSATTTRPPTIRAPWSA